METLVVLLVVGAVIAFVVSRSQNRKRQAELESVQEVRSVAEEDVTRLGEDVALLDTETAGRELDEATRQDYRRALDSYDAAKAAVARVRSPEDVKPITGILEDGRYAIACVQARLAGLPLPQRRPPCFFNPQHGPSSDDVDWAPPGGQPRPVPVCAADAERVPSRTAGRCRWARAAGRTGRAGGATGLTRRGTSRRTPAAVCCPECSWAR